MGLRRTVATIAASALLFVSCGGGDRPYLIGTSTTRGPDGVDHVDARQAAREDPGVTEAPTTTAGAASLPSRPPVVLGFGGDTAFTDGLAERDPFGQVFDLLRSPDFMMVNLETVVADATVGRAPVPKKFLFRSSPSSLDLLTAAGVDAVGLANNHTLDFGPPALAQTLEELDARDLLRVGAGLDQAAAYSPLIVEVGEWTIGLVSLARVPCDWSAHGENLRPEVAWACPPFADRYEAMVSEARSASDVVIVMIHGGEEGVLCPSPFMLDLEQRMAELGADVVINGHPHVVQGVGSWPRSGGGDTLVVHSTGNFAFPSANGITANSAVFLVDVSEAGLAIRVEPVWASGGVLVLPSDEQRLSILDQINRVSTGWRIDDDGRMIPAPEAIADC